MSGDLEIIVHSSSMSAYDLLPPYVTDLHDDLKSFGVQYSLEERKIFYRKYKGVDQYSYVMVIKFDTQEDMNLYKLSSVLLPEYL